jgi:hypothetical protein
LSCTSYIFGVVEDVSVDNFNRVAQRALLGTGLLCLSLGASAQEAAATATPQPRQPVYAPVVTPPGYRGPKVQQFRGFATPAVTKTPATGAAASAAGTPASAAKAPGKLPKPLELVVKSAPGKKAIHVTWKGDAHATTNTLERAESETGPFSAVAIMQSPDGSFDDENSVFPGTTYYYRMLTQFEGYNGAIVSPISSPVQVVSDKPQGTSLDAATTGSAHAGGTSTGLILPSKAEASSEAGKAKSSAGGKPGDDSTSAGKAGR